MLVLDGYANEGEEGHVYRYLGSETSLNLGEQDYNDLDYWKEELATNLTPEGFNFTSSDSVAVGGMVVYNAVSSTVEAHIDDAVVSAGAVTVGATTEIYT